MSEKLTQTDADLDLDHSYGPAMTSSAPGRATVSSKHSTGRPIILRVESAEAAQVFADRMFGPRDDNGVAADADQYVDRAASGSGAPLPADLRDRFESSLGADLSSVRIHDGRDSADAAKAVGAKAYTVGQDIHFGAGHYAPQTEAGQFLLAHEVAHTVQQAGATPSRQNKLEVSTPQDGAELEADRAAEAMVRGQQASIASGAGAMSRKILRDEEDEEMPELKSLQQHIAEDDRPKACDRQTGYNAGDVYDPKTGEANTADPVVANAKAQGALTELQRLSEEFSMAKPLYMSWIEAAAATTTIAKASNINLATPDAYRPQVEKMGAEMRSGSAKGNELQQFAASQDKSAASMKAASAGIQAAVAKVTSVRAKLAKYHAELERLAATKELKEKQDELAKVQAEIKMVANLLKQVSALATDLTKATSLFGMIQTTAKAYETGYNEITGTKDTTESLLQWAFYQPKIDAITSQISGLNKKIEVLDGKIVALEGDSLNADLSAVKAEFEKSTNQMRHEKEAYFAKMQSLGRRWD
jgi:hypothetical protein